MSMPAIPLNDRTKEISERIIWFESPEKALDDPVRFMAYALRYAELDDINYLRKNYINDTDLQTILETAPAGIIDARSWAYWNAVVGRFPTPSMPQRDLA